MFVTFFNVNRADICFFPKHQETYLCFIQLLNMIVSSSETEESHMFNILIEILLLQRALSTLNDLSILIISLFLNLINESLVLVK